MNVLAEAVGLRLQELKLRLVTAESCTGGLIAAELTGIPGSSAWFEGGFVTYRASAKSRFLGVEASLIAEHGVVSEAVARAMALGALERSDAQVSVSVTGNAGPGTEPNSPIGAVWFGTALRAGSATRCETDTRQFTGDRQTIRQHAVEMALQRVLNLLA